jgi:hypothetical protein
MIFELCGFTLNTTSAQNFNVGTGTSTKNQYVTFISPTFTFGAAASSILINQMETVILKGFTVAGTTPTILFIPNQTNAVLTCRGCDFSAIGSGKTLIGVSAAVNYLVNLIDCKLGASVTVAAVANRQRQVVNLMRCDSAGTNYRHERYMYQGTQVVDTTIVRTGGASDGTTSISWKIVSSSTTLWTEPFDSLPIAIWCDTTGSHAVTVYGTTTGGGVPNNDDIWIEIEYLGDASSPQGAFVTTTKANNLAASTTTNNSSDASTWGGGGAGNGFKMVSPSFTVNQKGYIYVTVKVAKPSATYYVGPSVTLS